MDIAMILDFLLPAAQYGGVPGITETEYAALHWEDARKKPTWVEVLAVWPEVEQSMLNEQAKPDKLTELEERIAAMEIEVTLLKEKT